MRLSRLGIVAATMAAVAVAVSAGAQQPQQKQQAQQTSAGNKIDKNADEILRQMSDYMAKLKSFQVDADIVDEAVTKDGQRIQFLAEQRVAMKRPNKLRTDRLGPVADTIFRYDGSQFALFGKRTKYYATAEAPGTIEEAVTAARDRYGIDAPGADLFVAKPYDKLMETVTEASYLGVEPISGMSCHHLAFKGAEVDFQIWVQDGDKPVPCRYVITSKSDPGQPEFMVGMKNWKTNTQLPDSMFAFSPPAGAKAIKLQALKEARK